MKKRVIAICMCVALVLGTLGSAISANAAPTVTVSSVSAAAGETVTVTVSMANCPNFSNIGLEVGWNSEVMTLTGHANNLGNTSFISSAGYDINPFGMNWIYSGFTPVACEGVIATLTFTVAADAAAGTYPITVKFYRGFDGGYEDNVDCNLDFDEEPLNLSYVNGALTIPGAELPPAEDGFAISNVSTAGEKNTFNVAVTAAEMKGYIIVAAKDAEGAFAGAKIYEAAAEIEVELDKNCAAADVMWWEGFKTMRLLDKKQLVSF